MLLWRSLSPLSKLIRRFHNAAVTNKNILRFVDSCNCRQSNKYGINFYYSSRSFCDERVKSVDHLTSKQIKKDNDPQIPEDENEFDTQSTYMKLQYETDVIYDYDEERILKEKGLWKEEKKPKVKHEAQVNYERGVTGVFDIHQLVSLLKDFKAQDIVVIYVPPELKFVDYLVIATGKSKRHTTILAEFIHQAYKKKKSKSDEFIKVEGLDAGSDWLAIDMGNIALHLMNEKRREEKDIETLWTVGPEYDENCRNADEPSFAHFLNPQERTNERS